MTRGVEALEQLQDGAMQQKDMAYLQKHGIKEMLSSTMTELLRCRCDDPLQFIIDAINMGADQAALKHK